MIMTRFWSLLPIVVQLFSDSICISLQPVCGDLWLQHVFFLVPPTTEIPGLMKFLKNVKSAMLLQVPNEDGLVQVICDPKDWDQVYRYTLERNMRPVHSAYCINKDEFTSLWINKPKTFGLENDLKTSEDRRPVREVDSVEDPDDDNSRVLRAIKRKKVSSNKRQKSMMTEPPLKKGVKGVIKRSVERAKRSYLDEAKIVSRRAVKNSKKLKKNKDEDSEELARGEPTDELERDGDIDDPTVSRNEGSESDGNSKLRKKGRGKKKKKKNNGRTTSPPMNEDSRQGDMENNEFDEDSHADCDTPVGADLLGELSVYLRNIVSWVKKLKNRNQRG